MMKRLVLIVSLICVYVIPVSAEQKGNILTQKMIDSAGQSLLVKDSYDLAGDTLSLPKGFTLKFRGGNIDNGALCGDESKISVSGDNPAFGLNIKITGTWDVKDVYDKWFAFDSSEEFVSNRIISNALALADDNHPTHIHFNQDRIYYFAFLYDGRADIGNMVSYSKKKDGSKLRHYGEMYTDTYYYLRMFTIPSNTRLTIDNKWVMKPTKFGAYYIFWEYDKENVTVDGKGSIQGDNYGHLYTAPLAGTKYYGANGHIFRCFKCRNFVFRDITLMDSFGDCILYTADFFNTKDVPSRYADGLLIENVKILRARRNGLVLGVRNCIIRNSYFEGCGTKAVKGVNPQCAIDLECDRIKKVEGIGNENVLIENCTFKGNERDIHSYHNALESFGKMTTVIRNCEFTSPIIVMNSYGIRFEDCTIQRLTRKETDILWKSGSKKIEFVNCAIGSIAPAMFTYLKRNQILFDNCKYKLSEK